MTYMPLFECARIKTGQAENSVHKSSVTGGVETTAIAFTQIHCLFNSSRKNKNTFHNDCRDALLRPYNRYNLIFWKHIAALACSGCFQKKYVARRVQ